MIPHVYSVKKEDETDTEFDFEKAKRVKWYDQVLLDRPSKVIFILLLASIAGPVLIYRFFFFETFDRPPSDGLSQGSCLIPRNARLPCGIGNTTEDNCHPQCCFDPVNNICFHRLPSRFSYIANGNWSADRVLVPRVPTVPYGLQNSRTSLKLCIDEQSSTHLTLTFYDPRDSTLKCKSIENKNYVYEVTTPEIDVIVNSTQGTVFNTARGPLIASDNIWEIAFRLTNDTMYGLGELPLKMGTTKVLYNHKGGFNSIPLIFARINVSYHGLLIDGSSPTEVSVQDNNHIVVRSITNDGLRIHLFVGPKPEDVMNDVIKMMESKVKLEYWMLGAHYCNETTDTLSDGFENLRGFITNATREKLPFESHCGTAPVVFTSNQCDVEHQEYIKKGVDLLKGNRKRFVPHVSPHIRDDRNLTADKDVDGNSTNDECYEIITKYDKLFYRFPQSLKVYQGQVEECNVIYPNYDYTSIEFMKGIWGYNVILDGVVFENNWPLDQSNKTHNESEYLPYFNQNFADAFIETPPWDLSLINNEKQYLQNHNRYGTDFANAFINMLNQTIPTWSSSRRVKNDVAVNRQYIDASWTNLHKEIIAAALGGISGHWLWSSPVCGDTENFDPNKQASLCVKWYMASTFFPTLKIHSRTIARDPLSFIGTHRHLIVGALTRRLSLSPYFYSTLQTGPLLRPMFYQFPSTAAIADINTQFSVGDDLIIVPNLQPLQSHVHFWLPPGTWYELWSGLSMKGEVGEAITMSTTEADFLTVVRGGSIIVMQKDTRETAEETRRASPMSLTIALDCMNNGTECRAHGQLFVTDNVSIVFEATEEKIIITTKGNDASFFCDPNRAILAKYVRDISVFGLKKELNNYDHHMFIQPWIDLCTLESNNEFPLS